MWEEFRDLGFSIAILTSEIGIMNNKKSTTNMRMCLSNKNY